MGYDPKLIRNFSIIAHIDHGKSTLADRLLEVTGTVSGREMKAQLLDSMDIERERGITIKAQAVRMMYKAKDGKTYQLNMVDTPGHVDFSYEVSRSMASCEGALLIVDAAQGVEAQTIANAYLAVDAGLEVIPVLNKVDLPGADIEKSMEQIEEGVGLDTTDILKISAKTGLGVPDVLEAIVKLIPPPNVPEDETLKALIFDSSYDNYRGVVTYVRVIQGNLTVGQKIRYMRTKSDYEILELGYFKPKMNSVKTLGPGEVGYIIAGIKDIQSVKVGDTITSVKHGTTVALPGYREIQPFVFAGLFPVTAEDFEDLGEAIDKIRLNDASLVTEKESSQALGFGFRCGFLGMLHMEIIQERLEREFGLDLVMTAPNVGYKVELANGDLLQVDNPASLPDPSYIEKVLEPFIEGRIVVPPEFNGAVMQLAQECKGVQKGMQYLSTERVLFTYEFPLSEIIFEFYDRLKSATKGYASFDYELDGYKASPIVKMDILINGEAVDALSVLVHKGDVQRRGRILTEKLKEIVPRQMFEVAIQAAVGGKIVARESVRALRKNVTAKCYGGDITRKRKLLEKQKAGKKRMKQVGSVEIPQEAFMAVLKTNT